MMTEQTVPRVLTFGDNNQMPNGVAHLKQTSETDQEILPHQSQIGEKKITEEDGNNLENSQKIVLQYESETPFEQQIQVQDPQSALFLESQIAMHSIFEWKAQRGKLQKFTISFNKKTISIREVTKLKCLSEEAIGEKRKIKMSINEIEDLLFGVDIEFAKFGFPLHYFWYAKIISSKLTEMGYDMTNPYITEAKDYETPIASFFCRGFLYKRSQFLKRWELRYVIINENGLFSFKNQNEQPSFSIKESQVKYIWTRFQFHEGFLIIKIKHALQQTQFAIPITNYCKKSAHNWLFAFYRLMMQKFKIKIHW